MQVIEAQYSWSWRLTITSISSMRVRLDYSQPVAAAMISANRGPHDARGAERRKSREKFLLAECRIRSESFVDEVRGGRSGPPGQGAMG